MTLKHKLIRAYHKKQQITVCFVSFDNYLNNGAETIEHLIDEEWIEIKPPLPKSRIYKNYSHSISPKNLKKYFPEVYKKYLGDK